MTPKQKRRRIVAMRLKGARIVDISRRLKLSQTLVRYHIWMDATDKEDRKESGGWYGTIATRREKGRARKAAQA